MRGQKASQGPFWAKSRFQIHKVFKKHEQNFHFHLFQHVLSRLRPYLSRISQVSSNSHVTLMFWLLSDSLQIPEKREWSINNWEKWTQKMRREIRKRMVAWPSWRTRNISKIVQLIVSKRGTKLAPFLALSRVELEMTIKTNRRNEWGVFAKFHSCRHIRVFCKRRKNKIMRSPQI